MPEYSYICDRCNTSFSLYLSVKDYQNKKVVVCPHCTERSPIFIRRDLQRDLSSLSGYVKKGDDEIKIGHLAARNTERMSADEKHALTLKHNDYKEQEPERELPKGMKSLGSPGKRNIPKKQNKVKRKPKL